MLTGKTESNFREWYESGTENILLFCTTFDELPLICQQALITEWFDSVGVFVVIYFIPCFEGNDFSYWYWTIKQHYIDEDYVSSLDGDIDDYFKTRPEAMKKALEKANEIYNKTQK